MTQNESLQRKKEKEKESKTDVQHGPHQKDYNRAFLGVILY